jgi:hypothetical protein
MRTGEAAGEMRDGAHRRQGMDRQVDRDDDGDTRGDGIVLQAWCKHSAIRFNPMRETPGFKIIWI